MVRMKGMTKRVRILETGEIFDSAEECAKAIGGSTSGISKCINGRLERHKGFTFVYEGWSKLNLEDTEGTDDEKN